MNLFDIHPDIVFDDMELGMRVAVAIHVENETAAENFIRILNFKYKFKV